VLVLAWLNVSVVPDYRYLLASCKRSAYWPACDSPPAGRLGEDPPPTPARRANVFAGCERVKRGLEREDYKIYYGFTQTNYHWSM
jgi:hypothetical protein